MPIDMTQIKQCIRQFNFKRLFIEELGWDHHEGGLDIIVDEDAFTLSAIAHKRGMVTYICANKKDIPTYPLRRKIESKTARSVQEHLIIYIDSKRNRQVWQWVKREHGKPAACREHHYYSHQPGDSLAQKLSSIAFSLEEEEGLTIVDITGRVRAGFDVDRLTKRFYDRFKKEHATFLKFIQGIPDEHLQRWYASVMLNRLMFIYFIQKKGFLNNDTDYLRNKLGQLKEKGKNRFYEDFLCPLFFEGFAKQESGRASKVNELLGKVPYLNGGIFQRHEIEELHGRTIDITDEAFEKLFDFFDAYQWHLDERPLRNDNEINPDVLGYIFEKYINQKQLGAYYTKEDITGYISRNTVIPRIFDIAKQKCKIAFEGEQSVWRLLRENPDRYIFKAMKKGIGLKLPEEIAVGIKDVSKRSEWNKPAPEEYALPTEIWQEVVARRQRYEEVYSKLVNGEISSINDFITYNLDICQFAQDVIEDCEGSELLRAIWYAIAGRIPEKPNEKFQAGISILDPACGSGAFLFAALNILESLYEACLDRMQVFLDELDHSDTKHHPEKFGDFCKILTEVDKHTNRSYFVYKSIIINNLFGVDIMEEGVEICKLRLFLKLVAQVEKVEKIEPLPDIDFNIRAGNTLVGFATYEQVEKAVKSKLDFDNTMTKIEEKAQDIDRLFVLFRQQQIKLGGDIKPGDKSKLHECLRDLEDELNGYLSGEYGIKEGDKKAKIKWIKSYQPFHWFVDFYGIMSHGGFNVIVGNPPYLEQRQVGYRAKNLRCYDTRAVHAMFIERTLQLLHSSGGASMIVPLALVSTQRMKIVQTLLEDRRSVWYSNYSWRPAKLFDTVNRALTIFVANPSEHYQTFSTNYQKWISENRDLLLYQIAYTKAPLKRAAFWVPKFGHKIERSILAKCLDIETTLSGFTRSTPHRIYYRTTGGLYWKVFTDFPPFFRINGVPGHSSRETSFSLAQAKIVKPVIAVLSSDIFWWWYTLTTNCRDLNPSDIQNFPLPRSALDDTRLALLGENYLTDLQTNSIVQTRNQRQTGLTETQSFKIQKSKRIIDDIDKILAQHYGLTDEELDFIINYDIKYRMGRDLNNNEN